MGRHALDPQVTPAAAGLHDLACGNQIADLGVASLLR